MFCAYGRIPTNDSNCPPYRFSVSYGFATKRYRSVRAIPFVSWVVSFCLEPCRISVQFCLDLFSVCSCIAYVWHREYRFTLCPRISLAIKRYRFRIDLISEPIGPPPQNGTSTLLCGDRKWVHACRSHLQHVYTDCVRMYMHMCVTLCMHVCMHASIHACMHVYVCIYALMCVHAFMHPCIHASMH